MGAIRLFQSYMKCVGEGTSAREGDVFLRYLQLGVLLMAVFFLALGGIRMAGASGSRKGLPRNPNEGQTFDAANIREVVLAGGCFWGVQAFLDRVPGVAGTEVT